MIPCSANQSGITESKNFEGKREVMAVSADEQRFRSIYQQNNRLLRWIAVKHGIPQDEIDDIVQDTFFSYYGHYPLTWEDKKIRYYLTKILVNKCIDYLRRRVSHPIDYMDPVDLRNVNAGNKVGRDPLNVILERQACRDTVAGLRNMKKEWSSIIILYTLQGKTIREISEMMNISEAACRMRLMRGRELLYQMVEREKPLSVKQKSPRLARKKSKDSSSKKYAGQPRYIPISQLPDS